MIYQTLLTNGQRINMPKKYSQSFLLSLNKADNERLGVQLAKACVRADLPITEVARVFGVSRMAVHNWFRGGAIRDKNVTRIKQFLKALNEAWVEEFERKTAGLPLPNQSQARTFLEDRIVPKIS
jgi:predicted DNA-binding protein YlxM (UPF0122 family)